MEVESKKIISDFYNVSRFRDILYFEIHILNYALIVLIPLRYLIIYITNDPLIDLKIILSILIVAAILFSFYIFYVLIKEKHFGWIATYFVMIIFPLLGGYIIFRDTLAFEAALLIPLLSFYFYCYLIKFAVDEWITKYNWQIHLEEQKKEYEKKLKDQLTGF